MRARSSSWLNYQCNSGREQDTGQVGLGIERDLGLRLEQTGPREGPGTKAREACRGRKEEPKSPEHLLCLPPPWSPVEAPVCNLTAALCCVGTSSDLVVLRW